jgi:hypothetical protein
MCRKGWLVGFATLAGLLGPSVVGGSAFAATVPPAPTLTGENLTAPSGLINVSCGNTGEFTFTVSGTATGPYTGAFTASGSGTVYPFNALASFTETFTISSPTGQVTGTKTISAPESSGLEVCYQDPGTFIISPTTDYQATISTSQGNYTDQGTASSYSAFTGGAVSDFQESFRSSLSEPTLIAPTSVSQCKNGGWQNYPQFKNQGRCIAYVEDNSGS